MKTLKYTSILFLLTAATTFGLSSCSEDAMDKVNKDNNHALDATAKFIVADLETSTAVRVVGGDYNTYLADAVEHVGGCHNQLYQADQRVGQWNASSTFDNGWINSYATLKNALIVINKCKDDATGVDAGNAGIKGIGEVMAAYNLAVLTDLFGDVPYTDACNYKTNMTPTIDSQESIYKAIMTFVESAITDLSGASSTGLGSFDFIYGGDTGSWLKFAYGLKARLTMHTIFRATDKNAAYKTIIECCDKSFASTAEQAAYNVYDATNLNPLFDFEWSRDGIAVSKSLYNKLVARNDPRMNRIYFSSGGWNHVLPTDEEFLPVPNGEGIEQQYVYTYDAFVFAQTASTYLLSYHEIQFLKAEALARLGQEEEAKACVEKGIVAAFANTEASIKSALNAPTVVGNGGLTFNDGDNNIALTEADAEAYYNKVVAPLSGMELLKEIMVQKYLAFYGANGESTECYNDVRRLKALGEDFITLSNPNNATKFPLRCGYGSSDTQANPNVQSAFGTGQYVYSENVWWAGGSR